jgi:flagellar biosynthetic protein FliR
MEQLLTLVGEKLNYTQELLMVALILGRTMPMIMLTPFLGGQVMPTEVKMGLGVLLTMLIWPTATMALSGAVPFTAVGFFFLMLKEAFIGMSIGFMNSHIFYAMDMAGRLIDTVRGTSMSEVMVPHSKQRSTPTGSMYYQLLLVIFFILGGHHVFLEGFFMSFASIPINETLAIGAGFETFVNYMVRMTANILLVAVTLAAPVIAATFITDVVFGILNRVAPQLNAYFMSMPVKALGGVVIIFISFGAIVGNFEVYSEWAVVATRSTIEYLAATMD